jgi:F0F1-type ATP synthase assembly protein I
MNCIDMVQQKDKIMKNSLYVIAGLLIVIWGIVFWGLHAVGAVHFILAAALFIILVRLVFSKQLSTK